jgi:hypothetical protein
MIFEESSTMSIFALSRKLEEKLGVDPRTFNDSIPWLKLPPGFSFKVIFPFQGAAGSIPGSQGR